MAVYLITLQSEPSNAMFQAIQRSYPRDYIQVGQLAWLVEDKEAITPQNVDQRLLGIQPMAGVPVSEAPSHIQPQDLGVYVISSFNGYWGYHNNSLWQWLQARGL
ncbi:hypothetical protein K5N30_002733 [Vibrio parahaemolyticus]|nr:hypothetical protein [Vibrio parahaemolyticus]